MIFNIIFLKFYFKQEHINYVKNKIGARYVGIGADYDGVQQTPKGLEDVGTYPELFDSLKADGWTNEELAMLAGENILRVLEANEKVTNKDLDNEQFKLFDFILSMLLQ